MNWLAALTDFSVFWLDWQFRAALFSAFILWAALGTSIRSPITRCAILIMGSWILLIFPFLTFWLPTIQLPILPFEFISTDSSWVVVVPFILVASILTLGLLIRFFLSLKALAKLHRSRMVLSTDLFDDLAQQKQVERVHEAFLVCLEKVGLSNAEDNIELCISPIAQVPLTYGVRPPLEGFRLMKRPLCKSYILLPDTAIEWPKSRLCICLMHELWHIKRRDWLSQQIASLMHLSLVLNPLAKRIHLTAIDGMESCVDKLCVQAGINPKDYAAELLVQVKEMGVNDKETKSLFTPTFIGGQGEYRYGDSGLQRRIGALAGEPFGWSSIPLKKSLGLFGVLVFTALLFSSITPVKFIDLTLNTRQAVVYVLPTLDRESVDSTLEIEQWPSLSLPDLSRTKTNYVDIRSAYEPEPDYGLSTINLADENTRDIESNQTILQSSLSGSLGLKSAVMPIEDPIKVSIPPLPSFLEVPEYPVREERNNKEGWVEIAFDLNNLGEPINPRIIDSSGSARFEKAAVQAILQSRYSMSARPTVSLITEGLTQNYIFKLLDPDINQEQFQRQELPP